MCPAAARTLLALTDILVAMKDKTIVITGASEGLGRATAIKLAAGGAQVALVARNKAQLSDVVTAIGATAHPYVCDVSDAKQVRKTAQQILKAFGQVDILVNCAGIWTDEELEKEDPDRRQQVGARRFHESPKGLIVRYKN